MPHVSVYLKNLIAMAQEALHPDISKGVNDIGLAVWELMPYEYAQEIQGCAAAADIELGWTAILNIAYELSDACTSIVAQSPDGMIHHARNLDFGAGGFLVSTMRNISALINFTKNGKVVAKETAFIGFIGTLSGQKVGQFTVTCNTRFFQGGVHKSIMTMLGEAIFAILNYPHANLAAFLQREVVVNANTYQEAVEMLSKTELIADIYYTVSGINKGEGCVITRNRTQAVDVWNLDSAQSGPGSWFVLMTNYDHDKKAPWFDNRMEAGYKDMEAMGQNNITLNNLMTVLSTKPTLNLLTAYSLLSVNSLQNQTYQSVKRDCKYPCAI